MADPLEAPAESGSGRGAKQAQEPTRAQRTIARRAAEARATVPDLDLSAEVDMRAAAARWRLAEEPTLSAILVRASALALAESPRANGAYRDGHFEAYSRVNIALAAWTEDSFTTPIVFDADAKPVARILEEVRRLRARAGAGELTPPELAGSTFSVFDLSGFGITSYTPLLATAHAAALGAGSPRQVPVISGGDIVPGQMLTLTLTCDHRVLYGAQAAAFLARIAQLLEDPVAL